MARALVNRSIKEEIYEPKLFLEFEPYDRYGDCQVRLNVEAELSALLAEEIAREIDGEILQTILNLDEENHVEKHWRLYGVDVETILEQQYNKEQECDDS